MNEHYWRKYNKTTHNYKLNDDHTLFAHYSHSQMKWILILKLNWYEIVSSFLEMCDYGYDEAVVEVLMQLWHTYD